MMKFTSQSLAAVLSLGGFSFRLADAQSCITPNTGFSLDLGGKCDYASVLAAYSNGFFADPINKGSSCQNTAEQDLAYLLGGSDPKAAVAALCKEATDKGPSSPFHRAAAKGEDFAFEQLYYNGGSEWNEQVQTTEDGVDKYILKRDAHTVLSFYDNEAEETQVQWPGSLTNFNLNTCNAHAAMCCWVTDRQANDNNGNCATPYDVNCVNKDPADNTDLCYVSHPDGNLSTKFDSTNGFTGFPGDDNNNSNDAEGPIHCHGFAWAEDDNDYTARYKANNLFYVSMYDHMYQRGYVRNVPGAPMCACVEQMPRVSRSDCTQIDVVEQYTLLYDGSKFHGSLDSIEVTFNACRGIDNRNNDLWAYMGRLYGEGKVTAKQWAQLGNTVVENNNCDMAINFHLATKHNFVIGYRHDTNTWARAASKGALTEIGESQYGKEGFKASWNLGGKNILMRKCQDCARSHQTIFYKRKTPVPADNFGFVPADLSQYTLSDLLMIVSNYRDSSNRSLPGHVYGTDFEIYSTLSDALAGTNEWKCTSYKYTVGFPGDCAPAGGTLTGQDAIIEYWWMGKRNAAWYFPHDAARPTSAPSVDIGDVRGAGQTLEKNGKYYMTSIGSDLWYQSDGFHFMSMKMSGDVTVKVKVSSLQYADSWTKAGLMIRSSLSASASNFQIVLTGVNDVWQQRRLTNGDWTSSTQCTGCQYNSNRKTAYLMITKRMRVFTSFVSSDGVTWTQVGNAYTFDTMGISQEFYVGLALTSHHNDRYAEAVFEEYDIESYYYPSAAPSISAAPSALGKGMDIGLGGCTACAGSTTVQGTNIIMRSKSGDIWGSNDMFQFYKGGVPFNQGVSLTQNFDVTVLLKTWKGSREWSKAGIMLRDSLNSNAAYCFVMVSEAHNPCIQFRSANSAGATGLNPDAWWTYPENIWLKMEKRAGACRGYYRMNDSQTWKSLGEQYFSFQNASGNGLQVGLAVAGNSWGSDAAVAGFDQYVFKAV